MVRYENLKDGQYEPIELYLGFKLNRTAAQVRPNDGPTPIDVIPDSELAELGEEMHGLAETLGYASRGRDGSSVGSKGRTRRPSYVEKDNSDLEAARCVVLVPIGGSVVPACEEALVELERRGYQVRRVRGYSAIDQGRNQMATNALADGFDETMWIDSDVGFDPDDIERLRRHNVPIVCGIYPQKGRRVLACHVLPGTEKLIFGDEGGLTEILYAGTGFLLVRREAYDYSANCAGSRYSSLPAPALSCIKNSARRAGQYWTYPPPRSPASAKSRATGESSRAGSGVGRGRGT